MKHKLPYTPFSTPFSPSKRMVEERIRSIIAGPQKRPPLPLLLLVLAFSFLSVNLISCQPAEVEENSCYDQYHSQLAAAQGMRQNSPMLHNNRIITDSGQLERARELLALEPLTEEEAARQWDGDWHDIISFTSTPPAPDWTGTDDGSTSYYMSYEEDGRMYILLPIERKEGELNSGIYVGRLPAGNWELANELFKQAPTVDDRRHAAAADASSLPRPDLNQNGVPEEIRLENEYGWDEVRFYEDGQLILRRSPGDCLCRLDGTDYILRCSLDEYQGDYRYTYSLSRFDGEFEEVQQWNEVRFDTNFSALYHRDFDPEAIAAFVEELNGLLSHSVRLSVRAGALLAEDAPPLELDWLNGFPDVFVRDPDRPLLENLKNFRDAMPRDLTPPAADQAAALPDRSYALMFCSGAGAWRTTLTLQADGSFEGDYEDADMDTHYVCQFHGRFGDIVQVSGASFYMTLEELVLDTKRPVGGEWDEGGIHYVSSEPYGFDGTDGKALKPGAGFIFYLPEATGHAPGTELYGAADFLSWHPDPSRRFNGFNSASDTLGCHGLYNLEAGHGFFDLRAFA